MKKRIQKQVFKNRENLVKMKTLNLNYLNYYLHSHRCPKFRPCFRIFVFPFVTLFFHTSEFVPNAPLCLILLRNVQKLQLAPFCSSQLFLALVSSFLALVSSFLALVSSCNLQLALVISSQLLLCSQMKVQTKRESFLNNAFTYAASSQLCYQQV